MEHEEDAYVRSHLGSAEVALLNDSQGVTIHSSDRLTTPERNKYANWCRYRAARLPRCRSALGIRAFIGALALSNGRVRAAGTT